MRRILMESVRAGMKLAQPIYGADGQIILNTGFTIQETHLKRIEEAFVGYIYVEDDASQYIDASDTAAQQAKNDIVAQARSILRDIGVGKFIDISAVKAEVLSLLEELCQRRDIQPFFIAMLQYNDYLFAHSVQVFFYSMLLGLKKEFDKQRLRELGAGAILHDTGMLEVPAEIVNKPGRLSSEETMEVKKHTSYGFDTLRKQPDISLMAANCALQHHERFDGSGYPRGARGKEIHEFARIVAIADVFAAMTSRTPYRRPLTAYDTAAIIIKTGESFFDPELIDSFISQVVTYPMGSIVRLSNNYIGLVEGYTDSLGLKPIVRVGMDENKQLINQIIEIDYSKQPDIYIADVVAVGK